MRTISRRQALCEKAGSIVIIQTLRQWAIPTIDYDTAYGRVCIRAQNSTRSNVSSAVLSNVSQSAKNTFQHVQSLAPQSSNFSSNYSTICLLPATLTGRATLVVSSLTLSSSFAG